MARKSKGSEPRKTALPKGGMAVGPHGGAGVLDPTTLPKPSLPEWGGWQRIQREGK